MIISLHIIGNYPNYLIKWSRIFHYFQLLQMNYWSLRTTIYLNYHLDASKGRTLLRKLFPGYTKETLSSLILREDLCGECKYDGTNFVDSGTINKAMDYLNDVALPERTNRNTLPDIIDNFVNNTISTKNLMVNNNTSNSSVTQKNIEENNDNIPMSINIAPQNNHHSCQSGH